MAQQNRKRRSTPIMPGVSAADASEPDRAEAIEH
jgi:hypothetical protein